MTSGPPSILKLRAPPHAATWCVTEGAAGMVSQVRGLATAVGLPFEVRDVVLHWPWNKCWPGFVPVARWIFAEPNHVQLSEHAPRVVISCGRQAIMTSLYLKRLLGRNVLTVHIQDPRIDPRCFDYVVTPEHDRLKGNNVLVTRGAIHHVSQSLLRQERERGLIAGLEKLTKPFVLVLLGGPNRYYSFSPRDLNDLREKLSQLAAEGTHQLAVLPSRRTPQLIVRQFSGAFGQDHFVWLREGENPYLSALAHCSHVICTADSVSMISEAAATGKPVYIEEFAERRNARRFREFHLSFARAGITRPFEGGLDNWTYAPPNDTERIARIIQQRLGIADVTVQRSAA